MKPKFLPILACTAFGCGGDDTDTGSSDTDGFEALDGLTFVQAQGAGFASYAFDAEDDIYIDYSAAPTDWALDGGAPLPDRKAFVETGYDGIRTFQGVIDWSDPEGATLGGDERWEYVMIFDEGYTAIPEGTMSAYDSDGELVYILDFGEDLIYTRLD